MTNLDKLLEIARAAKNLGELYDHISRELFLAMLAEIKAGRELRDALTLTINSHCHEYNLQEYSVSDVNKDPIEVSKFDKAREALDAELGAG